MTQPVAFDYSEQAADALLTLGVEDPRGDPEIFEDSVRALVAGWLATVDPDAGSGEVCVRDPRLWLLFVTGPVCGEEPPGLSVTVYVAGRRWNRGDLEPADDDSMAAAEHWNFVQEWPLSLEADGWRMGDGATRTLEEVNGYRFASRRETPAEYEARTGATSAPTQPPATRRFLLQASMVDYAAYYGGSASTIVERPTPPSRLEAEALLQQPMQAEMCRTKGQADYQPTVTALASYELLD